MSDGSNIASVDGPRVASAPSLVEIQARSRLEKILCKSSPEHLKRKSVRGGMVAVSAQALKFGLQTGSVMVLARLLSPADFGLQGMVVALTGILGLFRDVGLSAATVQREVVTHEQVSTLFWINVAVGAALTLLAAALAPALVFFYKEPRLYWVTIISALAFFVNGLAVQHSALLQRAMRFVTLAKIDVLSLALSSAIGVGMAFFGCGYWSLVGMALSGSLVSTLGAWLAVRWLPGWPSRKAGVRKMLHFGGTVTANSLVSYLSYNAEKVLLGRFWGAPALGLYGRAYQLVNLPVQQLNSALYIVAFPALSQMQDDGERLCRSFLRGYTVLLSITVPVIVASAIFAEEIVRTLLGTKWMEAAPLLRLLMPMVLGFALMNPFGWFLMATGRARRSLNISFLIAPTVLVAVLAGIRQGPKGVACAYSLAILLVVIPVIAWAIHGTGITLRAYGHAIKNPLLAGLLAGVCGLGVKVALAARLSPIPLLIVGMCVLLGVYLCLLLVVMDQRALYADLIKQLYQRSHGANETTEAPS
jgi:O-antigen/teichoic acid export membrane protein